MDLIFFLFQIIKIFFLGDKAVFVQICGNVHESKSFYSNLCNLPIIWTVWTQMPSLIKAGKNFLTWIKRKG